MKNLRKMHAENKSKVEIAMFSAPEHKTDKINGKQRTWEKLQKQWKKPFT